MKDLIKKELDWLKSQMPKGKTDVFELNVLLNAHIKNVDEILTLESNENGNTNFEPSDFVGPL